MYLSNEHMQGQGRREERQGSNLPWATNLLG